MHVGESTCEREEATTCTASLDEGSSDGRASPRAGLPALPPGREGARRRGWRRSERVRMKAWGRAQGWVAMHMEECETRSVGAQQAWLSCLTGQCQG